MDSKKVFFSVNEYDKDGDVTEEGIYLHFDEARVKVAENIADFKKFMLRLKQIEAEVEERWS